MPTSTVISPGTATGPDVPLAVLSAALDEIWETRQGLAYEADVVRAHLGYSTWPQTARRLGEQQIDRLQAAANGRVKAAYFPFSTYTPAALTVAEYDDARPKRPGYEQLVETSTASLEETETAVLEVAALRGAGEFEAQSLERVLQFRSLPSSRRQVLEKQVERLRLVAAGKADVAYAGTSYLSLRHARQSAGMPDTLTRAAWNAEQTGR